jgi:catechol 2,3-dioxygenase-like lactoylglutathione lyase family enzyme
MFRPYAFAPGLTVADLQRSEDFYTKVLGFAVAERWVRDGLPHGVGLTAGTCELVLIQDDWARGRNRRKGEGIRFWFRTEDDIDALAEVVQASGVEITQPPSDRPGGGRTFSFDDPDGFHLTIAREERAPEA